MRWNTVFTEAYQFSGKCIWMAPYICPRKLLMDMSVCTTINVSRLNFLTVVLYFITRCTVLTQLYSQSYIEKGFLLDIIPLLLKILLYKNIWFFFCMFGQCSNYFDFCLDNENNVFHVNKVLGSFFQSLWWEPCVHELIDP